MLEGDDDRIGAFRCSTCFAAWAVPHYEFSGNRWRQYGGGRHPDGWSRRRKLVRRPLQRRSR
jgi:hypothetical protein